MTGMRRLDGSSASRHGAAVPGPRWSVAIFARNEEETLASALQAVDRALDGQGVATLVLNGSTDGSRAVALRCAERFDALSVFEIAHADKANAWNEFVYRLRPAADIHFFVDAYALVPPDGFHKLAATLDADPQAHGATAVPSCGRGAARVRAALRAEGGLQGSLHALSAGFLDRICAAGIRLPVGMYWVDGLVGALAMHDIDYRRRDWRPARIRIAEDVSWQARRLSPWRPRDLRRQVNRMIQQARGRMQWETLQRCVRAADGYEGMPQDIDAALLGLEAAAALPAPTAPAARLLQLLALRRIARRSPVLPENLVAQPCAG